MEREDFPSSGTCFHWEVSAKLLSGLHKLGESSSQEVSPAPLELPRLVSGQHVVPDAETFRAGFCQVLHDTRIPILPSIASAEIWWEGKQTQRS